MIVFFVSEFMALLCASRFRFFCKTETESNFMILSLEGLEDFFNNIRQTFQNREKIESDPKQ